MNLIESQVVESPVQKSERRYGFLTVLSMVIGVMVGSGIFVKTQSSYSATHSAILVMSGWFLISLVVLCIGWAFLEIASSTKKSGKPGAINTWGRDFISPRAGKLIGFFFVFVYFPILLSILGIFFADQLLTGIAYGYGFTNGAKMYAASPWAYFFITTAISTAILSIAFYINTISSKPGKVFQVSGTGLALFPLILVISSAFTLLIVGWMGGQDVITGAGMAEVWDPTSAINAGLWENMDPSSQDMASGFTIFKLFITCLPGIMFTLDGFIWSASLSNETKKKNTLNVALVSGIIITIAIYVLMTFFTFATSATKLLADPTMTQDELTSSMTVSMVLQNLFPRAGVWLPITIQMFVLIAILTTISGLYITNLRNITALSEANSFQDREGKTFRRNHAGVPYHSGKLAAIIIFVTFFVLRGFDAWAYASTDFAVSYLATGFASDFIMLGSFSIYCLILIGGLRNRKTKQVDVDRVKGFVPATIFSSFVVFLVTISFAITILSPSYATIAGTFERTVYAINIAIATGYIAIMFFVYKINEDRVAKLTKDEIMNKQIFATHYHTLHSWQEIRNTVEKEISLPLPEKEKLTSEFKTIVEATHDPSIEHSTTKVTVKLNSQKATKKKAATKTKKTTKKQTSTKTNKKK